MRRDGTATNFNVDPMPTVFVKDGFRFFFYSNDHTPIHVHVRKGEGEAVFEVEGEVVLRESVGFKIKELAGVRLKAGGRLFRRNDETPNHPNPKEARVTKSRIPTQRPRD